VHEVVDATTLGRRGVCLLKEMCADGDGRGLAEYVESCAGRRWLLVVTAPAFECWKLSAVVTVSIGVWRNEDHLRASACVIGLVRHALE
jgi:hypothetical protein